MFFIKPITRKPFNIVTKPSLYCTRCSCALSQQGWTNGREALLALFAVSDSIMVTGVLKPSPVNLCRLAGEGRVGRGGGLALEGRRLCNFASVCIFARQEIVRRDALAFNLHQTQHNQIIIRKLGEHLVYRPRGLHSCMHQCVSLLVSLCLYVSPSRAGSKRETERERQRDRETERDRERERDKDRDRERQGETERDLLSLSWPSSLASTFCTSRSPSFSLPFPSLLLSLHISFCPHFSPPSLSLFLYPLSSLCSLSHP